MFNPAPLDSLKGLQADGAPDMRIRIVELFRTSSQPYWDSLRAAVASGDCDAAWKAAHALKSSSANVGGDHLTQRLARMESAGRGRDLRTLSAELPIAIRDYAQLLPALDAYVSTLGATTGHPA